MTWLCDSTELVSGAWLASAYPGHGVLGMDVPSDGTDGPSALYGVLSLPADNNVEVRGYITRWPTNGTLTIDEDGSFTYTGTTDYFEFQLFADGVASTVDIGYGAGISRITLQVGAGSGVRRVVLTLVNPSGTIYPNLSNLHWAFFDQTAVESLLAPVDKGSVEVTDASGVISIDLPNTTRTAGQQGFLVISNGGAEFSPANLAFASVITVQ